MTLEWEGESDMGSGGVTIMRWTPASLYPPFPGPDILPSFHSIITVYLYNNFYGVVFFSPKLFAYVQVPCLLIFVFGLDLWLTKYVEFLSIHILFYHNFPELGWTTSKASIFQFFFLASSLWCRKWKTHDQQNSMNKL